MAEENVTGTQGHEDEVVSVAGLKATLQEYKDSHFSPVTYATCSTAATTRTKSVVATNPKWKLKSGAFVIVKFSNTNTAENPQLNVSVDGQNTGAKSIWYNTGLITTQDLAMAATANRPMIFFYDGTQYVFVGWSVDSNNVYTTKSLGFCNSACSTAAATAAKTASCQGYELNEAGIVTIKFTNAITVASATLDINSTGAKAIYHKGAALAADVVLANDIVVMQYDGTNYNIIGILRHSGITKDDMTQSVRDSIDSITTLTNRVATLEALAEISVSGGTIEIATGSDFDNPTSSQRAKVTTVGSILDGIGRFVHLTKSEYDELTPEQKSDGTWYFIEED